ncbi:hypothetical protein C5L30_000289 [Companilactobacillus farciminis]|uniref:Glycosyl hydrolase family 8 n=2 Tax=Companilactobacillus farciminis TaxID=1612 RepID=A0A4R5NIY5_9LACO|nr:hypothetical protein [Companilactobacillus farciminis]ATO46065.1 hypothetical protein LF20184_04550 [Companilactobacillus farciminis KCTC 3681 = DSM 20184]KRK62453.1 hypothetical protein FC68_GL001975 [Companilactobacillus farciminis KCTC 3681 = DSM 20184]TDG74573.1 hypothetical protein C5L30_000289 [Companilactobacillus farciminis]
MKKFSLLIILLIGMTIVGCANSVSNKQSDLMPRNNYGHYETKEKKLKKFVSQKMVTTQGILTNYQKQGFQNKAATGHELLSESSGLWLEYLAYTKQYGQFKRFYQVTKDTFDQKVQFSYRYIPETDKKYNVNATLDDLRIIKALQIFSEKTGNQEYRKEAQARFDRLKKNTIDGAKVADFYDVESKTASSNSSLAYYDLPTLKYFEDKGIYQKQLSLVEKGYLNDALPLYASSFNWQNKEYSQKDLNTSEALITLLHLSQVKAIKNESLDWLQKRVETKTLYNGYSMTGKVTDYNQSAANYAISAMIFSEAGQKKMYRLAMNTMWQSQVNDKDSAIYGGIGLEKQASAYSFNNLLALLATKY